MIPCTDEEGGLGGLSNTSKWQSWDGTKVSLTHKSVIIIIMLNPINRTLMLNDNAAPGVCCGLQTQSHTVTETLRAFPEKTETNLKALPS